MSSDNREIIRIPNIPYGKMVDENGNPTPEEQIFRQTLITLLQKLIGNQGVVLPSQTTANITKIQNNQQAVPSGSSGTPIQVYTCLFGTMIYDQTTGEVKIAVEDPLTSGIPVFKTVTLT